jgi:hypothetical protein
VQPATGDLAMGNPRGNGANGFNRRSGLLHSPSAPSIPQAPNRPSVNSPIPNTGTPDTDFSLSEREQQEKGNNNIFNDPTVSAATAPAMTTPPVPFTQPYSQPYGSQYSGTQEQNTVQKNVQNTQETNSEEQASNSPAVNSKIQPRNPNLSARGNNWALKDVTPFSAAVSRNVKIQCEADKFVLVPQTGLIGIRVIPVTNSVQESTDKLVAAVWEFMDSWGSAGEKMFWRPILQIRVLPGGEQRFQELKFQLRNSGLVIEETR